MTPKPWLKRAADKAKVILLEPLRDEETDPQCARNKIFLALQKTEAVKARAAIRCLMLQQNKKGER